MASPGWCTHGVPLSRECVECEREMERAEDRAGERGELGGWRMGQDRYERWLDRIGGSA